MTNELKELAAKSIGPPVKPEQFRVFVFGPAMQPDEVVERPGEPVNHSSLRAHGKFLRFATKAALEKEHFAVDFGESADLFRFWQFCYKGYEHGSFELYHARWKCGAVIVFPSSEGSVCEVSLISLNKKIAQKTLAVLHEPIKTQASFFQTAVLELFWQANGTREYIDYEQHDACVEYAVRFVKGKYQQFLRDFDICEDSKQWEKDNARILSK